MRFTRYAYHRQRHARVPKLFRPARETEPVYWDSLVTKLLVLVAFSKLREIYMLKGSNSKSNVSSSDGSCTKE